MRTPAAQSAGGSSPSRRSSRALGICRRSGTPFPTSATTWQRGQDTTSRRCSSQGSTNKPTTVGQRQSSFGHTPSANRPSAISTQSPKMLPRFNTEASKALLRRGDGIPTTASQIALLAANACSSFGFDSRCRAMQNSSSDCGFSPALVDSGAVNVLWSAGLTSSLVAKTSRVVFTGRLQKYAKVAGRRD